MIRVSSLAELKQASRLGAAEIVITDEKLAAKMRTWQAVRTVANVLVVVILAVGIFAWVNPLYVPLFETGGFRLARSLLLAFGLGLLFLEYLLPGTRVFRIAGTDAEGLRLVNRRRKDGPGESNRR